MAAITVAELCRLTGFDAKIINKRLTALAPIETKGRYKYFDSARALATLYFDGQDLNPAAERARLDAKRREEIEQRMARNSRELIPKEEVVTRWAAIGTVLKGRLLAVPSRLTSELMGVTSSREIERRIDAAIRDALEELTADAL